MDRVIVIAGPTASGKTDISIKIAEALNGEVVSADSVQVYKTLDIGSAKIKEDEKCNIAHYMIDVVEPDTDYSIADFSKKADESIKEILSKGKTPLIVGGTGFYIQSLIRDVEFEETKRDDEYRLHLEELARVRGNEYVHNMLKEVDRESFEKIHGNNVKRVIRALEFYKETGKKISEHNATEKEKQNKYDTKFFVLYFEDRNILYDRVNMRVDMMVDEGLFEEVKSLLDKGLKSTHTSMSAIGYKEVIEYFDGKVTKEEAIENIKLNTRHLVKKQYTWFRHQEKNAIWIHIDTLKYDKEKIAGEILKHC